MIDEDIVAAVPADIAAPDYPLRLSQSSRPFFSPAEQQQHGYGSAVSQQQQHLRLEPVELERIFAEYLRTREPRLRDMLVLHHQRLVRSIVNRILVSSRSPGESLDDLMQVGTIGLIKALDRFDPAMGTRFSTYGTPMILGEIQKHLRDKVSPVKVPRALQERHHAARRASQELIGKLGRPVAIAEIAQRLSISEEEVLEAMEVGKATRPLSLDSSLEGGPQGSSRSSGGEGIAGCLLDLVGSVDPALAEVETRGDLHAALQALEEHENEIILLLFFEDMSQSVIAERLGISQMQVSRLRQRALRQLRRILTDEVRLLRGRRKAALDVRKALR